MHHVIYADVLVVINTYITYLLLLLTAKICRQQGSRWRFALSALIGGCYSLIILIPGITPLILSLSRIPAALLFVFVAFGRKKSRVFLRLFCAFLLVNFILAGLMLAVQYFISPAGMYAGSGVVYFDIDALTLILLTAVCYFVIQAVYKIIDLKAPKNVIYDIEIFTHETKISCRGFLDTGNSIMDPFTGFPVIIVSSAAVKNLLPDNIGNDISAEGSGVKYWYLPCKTVSGGGVLPCFKADQVHIQGISCAFTAENVVIAVTKEKIKKGEFDALLPMSIFENRTNEKGGDYDEKAQKTIPDSESEAGKVFHFRLRGRDILCKRFGKSAAASDQGERGGNPM
ncbi:MAG: sigma-E processing peptidase SpoIIGA [Oscillospiraceae bacterium]|nr:sigma-E processing peptidase SpoIIGA [Oscillospiraceae bacterium]